MATSFAHAYAHVMSIHYYAHAIEYTFHAHTRNKKPNITHARNKDNTITRTRVNRFPTFSTHTYTRVLHAHSHNTTKQHKMPLKNQKRAEMALKSLKIIRDVQTTTKHL